MFEIFESTVNVLDLCQCSCSCYCDCFCVDDVNYTDEGNENGHDVGYSQGNKVDSTYKI